MSPDYPCICSHAMFEHRMDLVDSQGCRVYNNNMWCGCYQFVPDNLRYLENKCYVN